MMPTKQRSSNIELCRIVSILLVVLIHSQFYTLGQPHSLTSRSALTLFLEACGIIGVNVFIMISGYFSIRLKLRSVLNLLFICVFCNVVTNTAAFLKGTFTPENLLFISRSSWFVLDYIGLMLLSPILNVFVENSTQKQMRTLLLLLLVYQTWFGWWPGYNQADFSQGYSILSFCILYLLMRYTRLYNLRLSFQQSLALYILCTVAITSLHAVSITVKEDFHQYEYSNPLVILSAFAFFNIFLSLKMRYTSVINHCAKSTLAILLLHNSGGIWPSIKPLFKDISAEPIPLYLLDLSLSILFVSLCCIAVDQIRLQLYQRFEKKLFESSRIQKIDNFFSELTSLGSGTRKNG